MNRSWSTRSVGGASVCAQGRKHHKQSITVGGLLPSCIQHVHKTESEWVTMWHNPGIDSAHVAKRANPVTVRTDQNQPFPRRDAEENPDYRIKSMSCGHSSNILSIMLYAHSKCASCVVSPSIHSRISSAWFLLASLSVQPGYTPRWAADPGGTESLLPCWSSMNRD